MRLIDADALEKIICQDCGTKFIDTDCNADCHIIETIKNMQTIEAAATSKVHGTMIDFTDEEKYRNFKACSVAYDGKCSCCGSAVFDGDSFCASCGAYMGGNVDE